MEKAFQELEKEGKNDVDNLVKWMKESKIVESTKEGEDKAKSLLAGLANNNKITLDKFKEAVTKMAAESNKTFDDLSKRLAEEGPKLLEAAKAGLSSAVQGIMGDADKAFQQLEKDGKNDVESLVKWMKDSHIVEATKEGEQKARDLLNSLAVNNKVMLDKFQESMKKLSTENDKLFDELKEAAKAGLSSLKDFFAKLMEATKEQEEKARTLFDEVAEQNKVRLEQFKEIVTQIAVEQKKSFDELSDKLAEEGPRFIDAAKKGIAAFQEALSGSGSRK